MSNRKKKSAFFVCNRREGEYFRQRNLTRGGGSRRGVVRWHRCARRRTVAWGLVRRGERLLNARSVRVVRRLPGARLVGDRRFRDVGTITNKSRSGCTYGLFQFLALLLQIFHTEQVILLHVTERPGFVLLVFLCGFLHGLLVA